jgi:hypothetical protein
MDQKTVTCLGHLISRAQIQNLPSFEAVKIGVDTSGLLGKVQHIPD